MPPNSFVIVLSPTRIFSFVFLLIDSLGISYENTDKLPGREKQHMAKIIGEAGAGQKQRAFSHRLKVVKIIFFLTCALCFVSGFVAARMNICWAVALLIILPAYIILKRLLNQHIRSAEDNEKGASGEKDIAQYLEQLPNNYVVVNDLCFADSYGNIDHLVIGPTGVFAIDVKNWRGTVSSDGKGELLYNGKPTDKPNVKNFTRRAMDLKDRIYALTKLDPYVQCVFVFPHTQLEAKWGTTGAVHCINAENITDYIIKFRPVKQILAADIPFIVSATDALKKIAK